MTPVLVADCTLFLTDEEREALLQLLEQSLADVRVERRRTEAPQYHDMIRHQEDVLRGLTEKLRRLAR